MISEIIIKNFKSYKKARLPLAPLTLLIGANASGKSNALEAMRILNWLAQGHKLTNIRYQMQDSDAVFRGNPDDIGYCGSKSFELGCTTKSEWKNLSITIENFDGELRIVNESVTDGTDRFLYKIKKHAKPPSSDIPVIYNNFSRGGKKPSVICSDQMAVFTQLDTPVSFSGIKAKDTIPKTSKHYQYLLKNIIFLDPIPSKMRDSEFKNERNLRGDARNISGVLHNLCRYRDSKQSILKIIKSLPEQDISDISFVESGKGKVILELVETFGSKQRKWDASLLSDGTLRVLAIAAVLLSAPRESIVVIEEVDNGVHPSRAKSLLNEMQTIAQERGLALLLSTHNPALMDSVPDNALGNVVFCYRDTTEGDSRLISLKEISNYATLVASGPLGRLATDRLIERFAKDKTTNQERKKQALEWVNNLRKEEN